MGYKVLNAAGGRDAVSGVLVNHGNILNPELVLLVQPFQELDLRVAELAAVRRNLEGVFVALQVIWSLIEL